MKKTFKHLEFHPHPVGEGLVARLTFDNGYGVSVVQFRVGGLWGSYTSNEDEWEVGITRNGAMCYDSGITTDVLGNLNRRAVNRVMAKVQALPPA